MILVFVALVTITGNALADTKSAKEPPGTFNGTFEGFIFGDHDSQAEMQLVLSQVSDEITGKLVLGEGLFIDGGRCWQGYLPAGEFTASGNPSEDDPNKVEASYTYKISGMSITGYLDGELSPDGQTIVAEVEIDIPWFCGPDPVLQVSAERQQ